MTCLTPVQSNLQVGLDNQTRINHQLYILTLFVAHTMEEFERSWEALVRGEDIVDL